jgi:hypothetical protein
MATRKVGSRQLVVDGFAYHWRIRHRATYGQMDYGYSTLHVAVQLEEDLGALLVLYTDRPHPADRVPKPIVSVRPSDVAGWVCQAIQAGWEPSRPGPQFHVRVSGSSVEQVGQEHSHQAASEGTKAEPFAASDRGCMTAFLSPGLLSGPGSRAMSFWRTCCARPPECGGQTTAAWRGERMSEPVAQEVEVSGAALAALAPVSEKARVSALEDE